MIRLGQVDMAHGNFAGILDAFDFPEQALAWIRWQQTARLGLLVGLSRPAAESHVGRVFWPEGELRWQRLRKCTRLVYLGEDKAEIAGMHIDTLEPAHSDDTWLALDNLHLMQTAALPPLGPGALWFARVRSYRLDGIGQLSRLCAVDSRTPIQLEKRSAHHASG